MYPFHKYCPNYFRKKIMISDKLYASTVSNLSSLYLYCKEIKIKKLGAFKKQPSTSPVSSPFPLDCKTVRIFVYSSAWEQSNKKVWSETVYRCSTQFLDFCATLWACDARALRLRETVTLTLH